MIIREEDELKKKNQNKQKKESLNFPLIFPFFGHRSRSKAERASLLEEDEDDGHGRNGLSREQQQGVEAVHRGALLGCLGLALEVEALLLAAALDGAEAAAATTELSAFRASASARFSASSSRRRVARDLEP
jgi:hypothetical protein